MRDPVGWILRSSSRPTVDDGSPTRRVPETRHLVIVEPLASLPPRSAPARPRLLHQSCRVDPSTSQSCLPDGDSPPPPEDSRQRAHTPVPFRPPPRHLSPSTPPSPPP